MRIVAGAWRGRPIEAPAGETTRPTSDRAREALFSMLSSRLGTFEGLRVADLFAGSGALGLEALSRGGAHCTFVETDRQAIEALRRNILKLGAGDRAEVRAQSALHGVPGPFDLVLMDPPYASEFGPRALAALGDAVAPGAWISLETGPRETVDAEGFTLAAERVHGKAKISLLTRDP
jgi:16S rRNA (guanine966-N2)-methyltransferase